MIRSLHPEEAQQSASAITSAKENREARDEGEYEALSSEFKNLLSKISTQYGTMPDQSVALGFALAQSIQQVKPADEKLVTPEPREEVQRDESDDSQHAYEFVGDEDSTHGEIREQVSDRETKTEKKAEKEQTKTSIKATSETDDTELLEEAVSNEGAVIAEDVEVTPETTMVAQQNIVTNTGKDAEETSEIATKVGVALKKSDAGESEEDVEEEALFGDFEDLSEGAQDSSKGPKMGKMKLAKDAPKAENPGPMRSEHVSVDDKTTHGDTRANATELANDSGLNQFDQSDMSGVKKAVRIGDEAMRKQQAEITTPVMPEGQVRNQSSTKNTSSINMALLQQAFERVQMMGSSVPKAQKSADTSASVLQSPMASSSAQSERGEEASKASRPNQRSNLARMLQRVNETLKEAARSRDGKSITLKLDPVDMGKVRVDVTLREGRLHAKITPDNQEVMQSLRENAHDLQASLRKLGLSVDSVSVSIGLERSEEEQQGQNLSGGSSFQDEGHNLPFEDSQLPENMFGNEIASNPTATGSEGSSSPEIDHWIA